MSDRMKNISAGLLGLLGLALVADGISGGAASAVMMKAAAICLECIGIG